MNTIPEDLAGYQNVINGPILDGDILVWHDTRGKEWVTKPRVGWEIDGVGYDIYRKMACPKAGDHDKLWQRARDNIEAYRKELAEAITNDIRQEVFKAKTDDGKKPPLAHLPWKALREVSHVQAYGKDKYGDFHNYRKGMEISRNLSCACRHIADFMDGQDNDEETKRSHLASAATRILFALQNHLEGTALDDRFKRQ